MPRGCPVGGADAVPPPLSWSVDSQAGVVLVTLRGTADTESGSALHQALTPWRLIRHIVNSMCAAVKTDLVNVAGDRSRGWDFRVAVEPFDDGLDG
jgi:hypothetical protein